MTDSNLLLVIDDEDAIRKLLQETLEILGYEVILCPDGTDGVEAFTAHRNRIKGVLLDMIMPTMSGPEAFQKIVELDADAKVVIMSGYSLEGEVDKLLKEGATGFLKKPFSIKDLKACIEFKRA